MRLVLSAFLLASATLATSLAPTHAQHRLLPVAAMAGRPALELALRKLDTVGNVMMTTAHPDDENNALLAYYGHTKGFRTSLVTATRGEGGQNEIGPELFEALAVLRTEELLAAHKFDGAEQYFTRAVDFGFSFSVDETIEKWGGQAILGDYVRMIRTIRPDVIVGFVFDGEGGGQHHQTSARLTAQAFRAAADPAAFPDQIAAGLRAWQPRKYYYTAGFFGPPGKAPPLTGDGASSLLMFTAGDAYDPLLGRTCNQIAAEARSMHKCQGMSQLLPLPGVSEGFGSGPRGYRLRDTVLPGGVNRPDPEMFDGIDTTLAGLAGYAGASAPAGLTVGLSRIMATVADARAATPLGSSAAVASLAAGLKVVRTLRGELGAMGLTDAAKYEIDVRLAQKERQFEQALVLAADVRIDAVANDNLVVRGQAVPVLFAAANRGETAVTLGGTLSGFTTATGECGVAPLAAKASRTCRLTATVPGDARFTAAHFKYATDAARFVLEPDVPAGLPFRPTPFVATAALTIGGEAVSMPVPVMSRSEGDLYSGEKRAELHVVPKLAVTATPGILIVPSAGGARPTREVRVTVLNHSKAGATADVSLQTPPGWRAAPATQAVTFSREDEAVTVKFTLTPPAPAALGSQVKQSPGSRFTVSAMARQGEVTFAEGYQVVEYPHTTRRHVLRAPAVTASVLDVRVKPELTVGYVMGVGDEVPQAIEQLGARVEQLTEEELAWGDLSRYDVILTGVRAYERRADLRAYNQRLLDYARAGGTVIVNYNKFEFNEAQYGPYPGKVTSRRVTDENSAVHVLAPQHPVFNTPNKITEADWQHWRQERGLYFFEKGDPQYTDLVEFVEPFPYNEGPKLGAMVEAKVGAGRWIYLGVGLWRQLPAGTEGAYRLLANLISLGSAPGGRPTPTPRGGR